MSFRKYLESRLYIQELPYYKNGKRDSLNGRFRKMLWITRKRKYFILILLTNDKIMNFRPSHDYPLLNYPKEYWNTTPLEKIQAILLP